MNVRSVLSIFLPLLVMGIAAGLNFANFLMGWDATSLNLIATAGYCVVWIGIILLFINHKKVMKSYSVFWLATTITAVITIFYNIDVLEALIPNWFNTFAMPFVLLLLPQWYGIDYLTDSSLLTLIIIFIVSIAMSFITFYFYKKAFKTSET